MIYFVIDLLKNIKYVNNLFLKIFKRSDFVFYSIINDSIYLYELEDYLQYKAFNPYQFRNIVSHLIERGQFSPKSQVRLMYNYSLYEVESINYIKNLILTFDFFPHAVCVFLWNMKTRLEDKYLEDVIKKYGDYQPLLFTIGRSQNYKINEPNSLYKYGHEFKRNLKLTEEIRDLLKYALFILALLAVSEVLKLTSLNNPVVLTNEIITNLFTECIIIVLLFLLLNKYDIICDAFFKKSLSKYLREKKVQKEVIDEILADFDEKEFFD